MDWKKILATLINAGISFGAGFGTATLQGAGTKMAIASGLVTLGANQAGLFQQKPVGQKL